MVGRNSHKMFTLKGMDLGWSGFTPVGYPKAVPIALADYVEENNLQKKLRFNLFTGSTNSKSFQTDIIQVPV